jgi:hypothetical protein
MLLEEMIAEEMRKEGLNPKKPCHVVMFWSRRLD